MRQVIEQVTCDLCGKTGLATGIDSEPDFHRGSLSINSHTWEFDLCEGCSLDGTLSTIARRGRSVTTKPTPPNKPKGQKKVGVRIDRNFKHKGSAPANAYDPKEEAHICGCGKRFVTDRGYRKHWTQQGGDSSKVNLKAAV